MRRDWPDDIKDRLGTMSDKDLAEQLGCARTTIFRLRQKLGVKCVQRLSVSQACQNLIDAVEASSIVKNRAVQSAIRSAKLAMKGVRVERIEDVGSEVCGGRGATA